MAEAVESALADRKHLIVEAGTGTGKTLAYLVPALLSGKRIVVSTGTKNLQEQLFFKDIPFLQQHFPRPLQRLLHEGPQQLRLPPEDLRRRKASRCSPASKKSPISRSSANGKRPPNSATAPKSRRCPNRAPPGPKMDARSDLCTGQKCPQFERCFLTLMHQRAQESDIVIVNHHLFFADLALQETRIVRRRHSARISRRGLRRSPRNRRRGRPVFRRLREQLPLPGAAPRHRRRRPRAKKFGLAELDRILDRLGRARRRSFSALFGDAEGRVGFHGPRRVLRAQRRGLLATCCAALELIGSHLKLLKNPPDEIIPLPRRTGELAQAPALRAGRATTSATSTGWSGAAAAASCKPRPSMSRTLLAERLFDAVDTVVLTSATLAVAGGFDFVKKRLGIEQAAHAGGARAISIIRSRRCSTCRSICPIRAARPFPRPPPSEVTAIAEAQPRPRVRAVHQLSADAPDVRPRLARNRLSRRCCKAPARAARCWKNSAPRPTACCSPRRRSGRAWTCRATVELRYHRQAALRRAQRSGGGSAHRKHPRGGRQSVLRLPDPAGRHRAEAGIRPADPQPDPTAACWSCWIIASPSSATARCFSTACRITDSPPKSTDVEKFFDV